MEHIIMKERNETNTVIETPAFRRLARVVQALSGNKINVAALAFVLLAGKTSADPFFFSTGEPDGKIATLSRPFSPGNLQTETADDFVVTQAVVISEATFTGLLPLETPLGSVSRVE